MAIAGMVLGIVGLMAWFLPVAGFPVTETGLVMSLKGLKSKSARGMAVAGVVTSIVGLVLTIINASIGAYMGSQNYELQQLQRWEQYRRR